MQDGGRRRLLSLVAWSLPGSQTRLADHLQPLTGAGAVCVRQPQLVLEPYSYPDWLQGTFINHVRFDSFSAPLGRFFVDDDDLIQAEEDAAVDEELVYPMRFVRRECPESPGRFRVEQDRAANALAESNAFLQSSSPGPLAPPAVTSATFDAQSQSLTLLVDQDSPEALVVRLDIVASRAETGEKGETFTTTELFEQRIAFRDDQLPVPPTPALTLVESSVAYRRPSSAGARTGGDPGLGPVQAVNRICKYANPGSLAARLSGGCAVSAFTYTWELVPAFGEVGDLNIPGRSS